MMMPDVAQRHPAKEARMASERGRERNWRCGGLRLVVGVGERGQLGGGGRSGGGTYRDQRRMRRKNCGEVGQGGSFAEKERRKVT